MSDVKIKVESVEEKKSILQMDVKDLFKSDIFKKEISTKGAIIAIGASIGIMAYGYFFVYPSFTEYMTSKTNLVSAHDELASLREKLDEIPMLQEKLDALTREAKVKSQKLSHDMEDGLFLIGLDKVIRDLEIDLKNYTIGEIVNYDNFYAIPMNISVEGDYRRVRELIYYLEEQKNITQVMDYDMTSKTTDTKKEVEKTVYWVAGDTNYHLNKTCTNMLGTEGTISTANVVSGTPSNSSNRTPDPDCVGDIANTIEVEVTSASKGEVSSNINFIVYSSEDNIMKLDTDKPDTWKPGKYNPFQDTIN